MAKTDCVMFHYDYLRRKGCCTGLTEMMCETRGECKFYKTQEQAAAQQRRCEARIRRLLAQGVKIPLQTGQ